MRPRPHPGSSVLYRTVRILEGVNIYSLVTVLLVVALFVMGNVQQFLDSSLLMLLRLLSVFSLICIASGSFYLISLTAWMIRRRHLMALRSIYGLVSVVLGTLAATATGLLQSLAGSA